MAVDFLIGTLLLISVLVNVLAIIAFRITPSLQTRSNSFVINLLVINVISCVVLTVFLVINTHSIREVFATLDGYSTDDEKRFFLDSVAALGALSLTLVIWDSHSAITDPLRYHQRLSNLKVGLMIAAVWLVGLTFGIGSYFWGLNSIAFTLIFCATIVLVPFCLICAMYYRIFREARENGLRMRQNGSSPLLQSALNLVTGQLGAGSAAAAGATVSGTRPRIETILEKSPSYAGLTLKIDQHDSAKVASSRAEFGTTESGGGGVAPPASSSWANLNATRKQSLRQMFLFGVNMDEEQSTVTGGVPAAERLLTKLNNLQLQNKEVRQVRSTPDLQRFLNPDGLQDSHHKLMNQERTVLEYHYRSSVPPHTPPKHLGYMTSIRHRLSNASSLFKYREESRAARISILVVIMFLISYIPYGLLMVLDTNLLSHYAQTVLSILVVVVATIGSPIIFAYRNKRVQRAVKRLLRLETKELLPTSCYPVKVKRKQPQPTMSLYKKNLVLKSGAAGRKMQTILLNNGLDKPLTTIADAVESPVVSNHGYENYLDESRGSLIVSGDRSSEKRGSTTSTASTVRCEEEEEVVDNKKSPSPMLSRFGFIRRQSGPVQKYGVSV